MDEEELRQLRRRRTIIMLIIQLMLRHLLDSLHLLLELFQTNEDNVAMTTIKTKDRITIEDYVEKVAKFTDWQFREDFRLTRTAFDRIENIIGRNMQPTRKPFTSVRKELLATIWLLGTPESYRYISERFGLEKSVLYICCLRIVQILCQISRHFIKWPEEIEQNRIKRRFLKYKIPGVIGAVDGTFVYCSEPKENSNAYNTRKCRHVIQLQAIAITNLKFIDIFAGYPGSVGDLRVFRNSFIYKDIERNPSRFFPNDDHILGDKAYPLKTWCITPYKDNGRLTQEQRNFNQFHSSSRCTIERSFSLLKGRFRRLKFMEIIRHDLAPYYILAACVLHNVCIDIGDDDVQRYIEQGSSDPNPDPQESEAESLETSVAAIEKRNYLCSVVNRS